MPAVRIMGMLLLISAVSGLAVADDPTAPAVSASKGRPARIPTTMRGAAIDRSGGPQMLTLHTLPVPKLNAGEVLIAVNTAGVGIWDVSIRQGSIHNSHAHLPLVLGTDGAGIVAAVGSGIRSFKIGDEAYSYSWDNPKGGFYAEYVAVAADRVGHVPPGLSLRDAGAIATTGLTAIQGIDDALHLQAGQTLIIHGAAGGVGSLALQFARLRGARVLATASGEDGSALVRRLGAATVVDARRGNIATAARGFAPGGVDAVLALAGGEALERCIDAVRRGGRVAFPHGVDPEPKARDGINIIPYDAVAGVREFERLNRAVEAAKLEVPIAGEFPLEEAAKAHARLEAGHVVGKIVLRIR
jgi:NADPH2:quinone reductase